MKAEIVGGLLTELVGSPIKGFLFTEKFARIDHRSKKHALARGAVVAKSASQVAALLRLGVALGNAGGYLLELRQVKPEYNAVGGAGGAHLLSEHAVAQGIEMPLYKLKLVEPHVTVFPG